MQTRLSVILCVHYFKLRPDLTQVFHINNHHMKRWNGMNITWLERETDRFGPPSTGTRYWGMRGISDPCLSYPNILALPSHLCLHREHCTHTHVQTDYKPCYPENFHLRATNARKQNKNELFPLAIACTDHG